MKKNKVPHRPATESSGRSAVTSGHYPSLHTDIEIGGHGCGDEEGKAGRRRSSLSPAKIVSVVLAGRGCNY